MDTGNYFTSPSYKPPYGITFPGKPSGRFSDGRVLTDYVGNYPLSLSLDLKLKNHLNNESMHSLIFISTRKKSLYIGKGSSKKKIGKGPCFWKLF